MKNSLVPWPKLFLATITISLLVALAAKDLAPHTPISMVYADTVGGAAIFSLTVFLVMWLKFVVNQFLLNAGATDTQWLWFKSDPDGLKALQSRSLSRLSKEDV
jgi:hypothetical protein